MNLSVLLHGEQRLLPLVLCGPVLRRVTENSVTAWIAFSVSPGVTTLTVKNSDSTNSYRFHGSAQRVLQTGQNLYLCCITANTTNSPLIPGEQYYYDIDFEHAGVFYHLADNSVLTTGTSSTGAITYPSKKFPGFIFLSGGDKLNIAHASCRKPHGTGADAMGALDKLVELNHDDPANRPHLLCLTGDQIYADDVSDEMLKLVREIAIKILGDTTNPTNIDRKLFATKAGFSSEETKNHLISYFEFSAMYLLVWSDTLWPDKSKLSKELQVFYDNLSSVRRALANIPTYMIFDDHEITDDWNITRAWFKKTECLYFDLINTPADVTDKFYAHAVVANGVLAYALFQGWGNLGDLADTAPVFKDIFLNFYKPWASFLNLQKLRKGLLPKLEETLDVQDFLTYDKTTNPCPWAFRVNYPDFQLVFLDTRMMRGYSGETDTPALIARHNIAAQFGNNPQKKLTVVVAPTPVFGFDLVEWLQCLNEDKFVDRDAECWSGNWWGYLDIQKALVARGKVIILSGDVHYGFTNRVVFWDDSVPSNPKKAVFMQCCSSALKNHPGRFDRLKLRAVENLDHGCEMIWENIGQKFILKKVSSNPPNSIPYQFRVSFLPYIDVENTDLQKLQPLLQAFTPEHVYTYTLRQIIDQNHIALVSYDQSDETVTQKFYAPKNGIQSIAKYTGSLLVKLTDTKPI